LKVQREKNITIKGKNTNQGIINPFKRQQSGFGVSNKNDIGFYSYVNKNEENDFRYVKFKEQILAIQKRGLKSETTSESK